MTTVALNVLYGAGMSSGMILTGMNHPVKTWSFFNLRKWNNGTADYTLGIIFPIALASHYIIYRISQRREKPVFEESFQTPTAGNIDNNLILGSTVFGLGWAISGYCPTGAVTAAFSGQTEPIVTILSMFAGWCAAHVIKQKQNEPKRSIIDIISNSISFKSLGAVFGTFALIQMLTGNILDTNTKPWSFSYTPIIGGILIGTSIGSALCFTGQILGTSGTLSGTVIRDKGIKEQNIAFLCGIGLCTALFRYLDPTMNLSYLNQIPIWRFCLGGFLTGIGSGLANGCTSGHGICGVSRMSTRSLAATGMFMASSAILSTILNL